MEKKPSGNRFFRFGDEDSDEKKAGRILSVVIIAILTVSVVIIGIVAASQRDNTVLPDGESNSVSESESVDQSDILGDADAIDPDAIPEMLVPTAGVVSKEHDDSEPVFSNTMGDYRTHSGIDIATSLGAGVVAVADGTVERVWEDPMMGTCLSLAMNGNAVAIYRNLGQIAEGISAGSIVSAGDILASVGDSALLEIGDEAHLHFELEVAGEAKNPLDFFKKDEMDKNLTQDSSTQE